MRPRVVSRRAGLVVSLALFALFSAMLETALVHTDDGCALETHCNACLLQLGTNALVTASFSLPDVPSDGEPVLDAPLPARHEPLPQDVATRGPPARELPFV